MSTNEEEVIIDPNKTNEEEGADEGDNGENNGEEGKTTPPAEKPKETLEERRERLLGQLKRINKDLGITDEPTEKKVPNKKGTKSEGFDWGEKAYLTSNGIKGSDEHEFAQKLQKQTGLDLDSLLEDTYFQTKLNEFREQRATTNATPSGTKRSSNSSVDTVEYWIAKGELPPKDQVEMRRKVVNARLKKEDSKGVFYNS